MNTFIGNIEARLDGKGRVFIPATYRKILAEMGSSHIIMRRDTDNECVIFYPEHVWHAKVSELRNALDEWDPEDQMILMQFMSEAEILEMDSQGRVLLQKKNLEMIDAQQDILFVGMLDRFAIWNPTVFAEKQMPQKDLAERIRIRMKSQPRQKELTTQNSLRELRSSPFFLYPQAHEAFGWERRTTKNTEYENEIL